MSGKPKAPWCKWCGESLNVNAVTYELYGRAFCGRRCEIDYLDDVGLPDYGALLEPCQSPTFAKTLSHIQVKKDRPFVRAIDFLNHQLGEE